MLGLGPFDVQSISLVSLLIVLAVILITTRRRKRLDLGRIPSASLLEVLRSVLLARSTRHPHTWIQQCHEKYGPIFRVRLAYRELVMVADTQAAQHILCAGPNYLPQKAYEYSAINPVS
jgi:hypothetical protein